MAIQDYLGVPIFGVGSLQHRLSYREKKANNWKWIDDWIDYYDASYDIASDTEDFEKIMLNYRLWNGRGVHTTNISSDIDSISLQEEGIYFNDENIPHHDIIIPIGKSLHGQQQLMPFKPIVTDSSLTNVNLRHKKKLELRKIWLQENILNPIKEQAYKEWASENGIEDMSSLQPEQQQEAQSQIEAKIKSMTPKDIDRFLAEEYKSPSETQLQKITEYVLRRDKIKYWTDENFKHMIISGKQVYDTGIRNGKAYLRILNPAYFTCGGADDAHFIEDMDWGKYEEYITLPQLFNDHGAEMKPADLKKLEQIHFKQGSPLYNRGEFPEPMNTRVAQFDARTGLFDHAPNLKTREGQEFIKALYAKFGSGSYAELEGIRRVKVVFKSLRKLKLVDRYNRDENKYTQFWVDDSYEKNPKKDIRIREVWLPHLYMGEKVGVGADALYFNKGPLPNQYKTMNNPFDVKLPFMGVEYSKLFNNTTNIAPLDLAKPWQDKFNIQMAKITEIEATDVGRIFAVATGLKPKDWTWGKWLMMAKYGKLLPLDTSNEDINGIDGQMFKDLNLSQMQDLASKIQYLDWIKNQAALAMSYNPARLGQIVPSAAVSNTKQNIQQSTYQTQDLFTLHNEVVEKVMNRHILNERAALKDNDYVASYILDDMSRADLKLDKELFDLAEIGISIRNNADDFNTLNSIKSLGQAMIQNQMITFPEFIRLQLSNNMADTLNIAERAEQKMLQKQEEMMQQQQQQQQMALQQQQQIEQMRQEMQRMQMEFEAQQKQLDRQVKMEVAGIDAMKFKNQMDVDQNNESDLIQKELIVLKSKEQEAQKDRDSQKQIKEMELKNRIELEKIKQNSKK